MLPTLLFVLATCALAQPPAAPKYEIHGIVEEFGLGLGLAGAELTVERYEGEALSSLTPKSQVGAITTKTDGAFHFAFDKPGTYRITARREGYILPGSPMDGFMPSAQFPLSQNAPSKKLTFYFARPAEISGTLIDEETRQPVAGLPVVVSHWGYSAGRPILMPGGANPVTTGPDGRFVFTGLVPTNTVVVVGTRLRVAYDLKENPGLAKHGAEPRILTEFNENDREVVDLDYDISYWPGAAAFANVSPVQLASAAKLDLGHLRIRKIAKYRVQVSMAGSHCDGITSVGIAIRSAAHPYAPFTPTLGTVPCGGQTLLRGFAPGEYDLEAVARSSENGKPQLTASARFQVGRGPETVPVSFLTGATISGSARLAEGAKGNGFDGVRVMLQPTAYGAIRHGLIPISDSGQFRIENVGMREYRLRASGIPDTHYLKEVRYNGIPMPDRVFTFDSGPPEHALELIFDDRPAAIAGTVKVDGKPVPQAYVVLAPLPLPEGGEFFAAMRFATADDKGNFALVAIPPGEYRLFALPVDSQNQLHRPGEKERLTSDAEKITVSRGQTRVANLTLAK